ncbi:uncharacterized protein ACA1_044780, partial [Acanthamoeba castellanii str. Neff]
MTFPCRHQCCTHLVNGQRHRYKTAPARDEHERTTYHHACKESECVV